jgi:hypothetical protein
VPPVFARSQLDRRTKAVIDDDALFGDEAEGEDNPFVMGGFARYV